MIQLFFPSSGFAWVFVAGLLSLLIAASWSDMRRMIVPKWISLTTLAVGVIASMARGAWLGWAGLTTWILPAGGGLGLGLLDGLLFALAGVAVGFTVMLVLWILGVCGGGDVKLYAAVGAWVGPLSIFPVLGVAGGCLCCVGMVFVVLKLLRGKAFKKPTAGKPPKHRVVAFSWPLAVGALLVLAFLLGRDQLMIRSAIQVSSQVQNDAH
ncbi:MAG TPA: prepilin peptidase [Gemmataceae bacterium]|nr:prepilin peptidase [Gemmataceae bacterium]